MNREYIRINENEILVTDDNGKITRRKYEPNIDKKLDNENKEEIINAFTSELSNQKENIQNLTEEIKAARKIVMITLAILTGILLTLGVKGVILNPINTILSLILLPPITSIFTNINKKYINNMDSNIECLEELKQKINQEKTVTKNKEGIITLDINNYIDKVEDTLIENKNKPKTKIRKK